MAEIAQQRDYKAALYEAQRLKEIEELEEAKRKEEYKRKIIAEARRKLLEEHASVLVSGLISLHPYIFLLFI